MPPLSRTTLDALPPVVQLLLRNLPWGGTVPDFHTGLRKLLPELRRQSEFYVAEAMRANHAAVTTPVASTGTLSMNLTGALDPFSPTDKCADWVCRLSAAERIARFVALYSDAAYVPDHFTQIFAFEERWSRDAGQEVMLQLAVLGQILPLIDAGILKFSTPVFATCSSCDKELWTLIETAAQSVVEAHAGEMSFKWEDKNVVVHTEPFDHIGLKFRRPLRRGDRARLERGLSPEALGRPAYAARIARSAYETCLSMSAALPRDTTTVVGSRATMLAVRELGNHYSVRGSELAEWEASRATDIPWVRQLTLPQTLQLRESAVDALPRFRARMASGIADTSANRPAEISKLVAALRDESAEVEQELRALNFGRGERFRNLAGALALTVSVYGFAAEFVPASAALGGLMSALALIHQDSRKSHQERGRQIGRPGFVLLKARELLAHADPSTGNGPDTPASGRPGREPSVVPARKRQKRRPKRRA